MQRCATVCNGVWRYVTVCATLTIQVCHCMCDGVCSGVQRCVTVCNGVWRYVRRSRSRPTIARSPRRRRRASSSWRASRRSSSRWRSSCSASSARATRRSGSQRTARTGASTRRRPVTNARHTRALLLLLLLLLLRQACLPSGRCRVCTGPPANKNMCVPLFSLPPSLPPSLQASVILQCRVRSHYARRRTDRKRSMKTGATKVIIALAPPCRDGSVSNQDLVSSFTTRIG